MNNKFKMSFILIILIANFCLVWGQENNKHRITFAAQTNSAAFFSTTDQFFKQYINNGRVDYKAIQTNPTDLNELISLIASYDTALLTDSSQRQAFWINAYNLTVIHAVLQNYPLKSVQDVGGFFDSHKHAVGGETLTLNDIEQKKLLQVYSDPRFHFVLVCAAIGCPQIINTAYQPDQLEQQIERRTRITLNDVSYVRLDADAQKVYVTELFKWYKKDFTSDTKTVIQYINQYRDKNIPQNYTLDFITYDWTLNEYQDKSQGYSPLESDNLQAYTPSTLLKPGQFEIKIFNNLYTQTAFFDGESNKQDQNGRSTFFTGINSFLYGFRSNLNIGFDLYLRSVRNDDEDSSPISVFNLSSDNNSRSAFSHLGPKIKISPFTSIRNLAFQTVLLIPLVSDLDGSEDNQTPYLDVDGAQWWTQIFYDFAFQNSFLVYFEGGLFFRFDSPFEDFYTPFKAFLNYYPSQKWTIYLPTEFTAFWDSSSLAANYAQLGLGGKYQLTPHIELEALYTKFILGKSQGAGQTFNLGFRIIR